MKSGGILVGVGLIVLTIFLLIFLRQRSINIPGLVPPTVTPTPNLTITPTPINQGINQNISTILENKDNLKLFYAALKAEGIDSTLTSGGPYTIFSPNDSVIINNLNKLPRDSVNLKSILQYHIVNGSFSSTDLVGKSNLKTLRGDNLIIDINKSNGVTINGVKISEPDIKASNGIIHIIDGVLIQ